MNANLPRSLDLTGKFGLITGIANEHSIAWGCARAMRAMGAELALTYATAKAEPYVRPLAEQLDCSIFMPCDVQQPGELEAVFSAIETHRGRLDFLLHSIAFAPRDDLHGRVVDCSRAGFGVAMDVSCHSFIRMAKLAEPLMKSGGTLLTMTYIGADAVIPNYNLMGPVKAALEATSRYLAAELGAQGIRVHAISPGPMATRAGSGLKDFDALLQDSAARSPLRRLVTIDEVGALAAFLVSDAAAGMTGNESYVDGGYHIVG